MKIKKAVALSTVLGVALAGIAFAGPSNADPVSGGYTITGSDTLQDAVNALVNGTRITGPLVRITAGGNAIGNYDATGSLTVQLKDSVAAVGRPSGSGDGKKSLSRSIDGGNWVKNGITSTITGQVDLARSSSGAGTGTNGGVNEPNGPLTFIPFGRDAVSYAFKFGTGATLANTPGIDQLTSAQLSAIYTSATPVVLGSTTVVPLLPQSTSGTRTFFLGAIGAAANPAGVPNAATSTTIENDATVLTPAANTVQIIPFSAASWVAQANGATAVNTTGTVAGVPSNAFLGSIGGVAPFTVVTTSLVPNKPFYDSTVFGRDTYIIAGTAALAADPLLAALVDPTLSDSLTFFGAGNSPASAKAVKLKFGFLAPLSTTTFHTNLFS